MMLFKAMHSFYDNEDEGGQEHQGDALMSDHVIFSGVGSVRASHEFDSNLMYCSK